MGGYLLGLVLGLCFGFILAVIALSGIERGYIKDCEQFGKVRIHETVLECRKVGE